MPRPKKDSYDMTGKERIKEAFWELYMEKPIEKIGIKEIAALAECNRTTFYYYYDNINSVLEEIESEVILKDGPQLLVNIVRTDGNVSEFMDYVEKNETKIRVICHLLSSRGDPGFLHKMKAVMLEEWRKLLFPNEKQLPHEMRILLEYFMGGSLSLMGSIMDNPEYSIEEILEIPIRVLSRDVFAVLERVLLQSVD